MKTIKANNYANAYKQLAEESKKAAEALSEEIRYEDRHHYHSVMVKIKLVPGSANNDVSTSIVKSRNVGFEKLQKKFAVAGADKLILLHDPSKMEEQPTQQAPAHHIKAAQEKIAAEQAAENQKEFDARVNAEVEKRMAAIEAEKQTGAVKEVEVLDGVKGVDGEDLQLTPDNPKFFDQTVAELEAYAKAHNIDLTGIRKKDDIKAAILAAS